MAHKKKAHMKDKAKSKPMHKDEAQDKKLIKEMVKKDCTKK